MAEETVWTGSSSQFKNLGIYLLCGFIVIVIVVVCILFKLPGWLLLLAVLPAGYAFWKWLRLKSHFYRLTTERLLTTMGMFSKTTETLELYRVKDLRTKQSFFERHGRAGKRGTALVGCRHARSRDGLHPRGSQAPGQNPRPGGILPRAKAHT